jgi:hypothetical protein
MGKAKIELIVVELTSENRSFDILVSLKKALSDDRNSH